MTKVNKNQQVSLLRKWKQEDQGLTFIEFRRSVQLHLEWMVPLLLNGVRCGLQLNQMGIHS